MVRQLKILICMIGLMHASIQSSELIEQAKKTFLPDRTFFPTRYEQEQMHVGRLKNERQALVSTEKNILSHIAQRFDQLKQQINTSEEVLKQDPEREGLKKVLDLSLELVQIFTDKKQVYDQRKVLLDEQLKIRQEYLADPDLAKFYASLHVDNRPEFSFDEDLLKHHEMIMEQEKVLYSFHEQESHATAELDNRKRTLAASLEAVAKKEKKDQAAQPSLLSVQNRDYATIRQLKEEITHERYTVNQWRVQEIEQKLDLIRFRIGTVRQHLDILNEVFTQVKHSTRVTPADVSLALDELDRKRQHSFTIKDQYRQEIERIQTSLKDKDRALEVLSKRYNIAVDTDLEEWNKVPRTRASAYIALAEVGALYHEVLALKRKKELLEAQSSLEEERLRSEGVRITVKQSFYGMAGRNFAAEEEVAKEIKKYDTPRAEAGANLARDKERQNTVVAQLSTQKKGLDNLTEKLKQAPRLRTTIFAGQEDDYEHYVSLLKHAQEKMQEQHDILSKLSQIYGDLASVITNTIKHIDFIYSELSAVTIWYRPEHAISWQGVKDSLPDLRLFFKNVAIYLINLRVTGILPFLQSVFSSWLDILFFLLKILLLFGILLLIKRYLPFITNYLISLEHAPTGVRWVSIATAIILGFGLRHIVSLIVWILLYFLFFYHPLPDPYPLILFYLCSIPYLLYFASRLMRYVVYFNVKYDYVLLSREYQRRFIVVLTLLVYGTIIITFLREAFILGLYRKSELPTIFLALNFIIFQISAILLLSKDQILSLIPVRNNFWLWIRDIVDGYYYLIQLLLIAIIVLSNPYVGYGRLVLYILKRVFFTAILMQLLVWLHEWLKRVTSRIFFDIDVEDDIVRDRFSYAKTWYGMLVVAILLAFTFLGCIIAARIWGWPELLIKISTWSDIVSWIKTPFLLETTKSPISLYTIARIFGFVGAGIFMGFIINRFVLGRIFDILLIEAGVQNTVSSLVRYLVIIAALIVGFQSVGLGELVWYLIGALILGLGWVIKDPLADLIAYFIIILQQPIKVGDYIWVDENTNGVVRRITPRSVEIRRKNSTTLVVPNVFVTTRAIANWNFVRGFIAFEDITITVPFKHDPQKVKELLLRVLDESRVVLKNPRPIVRLDSFSKLGYVFLVRGYLSSHHTLDMWDIASDIRLSLSKKLKEHDIELASGVCFVSSEVEK